MGERGFASTVEEAISVGNAMMKRGMFSSATGAYPFKNEEALFRFKLHDEDVRKGCAPPSSHRLMSIQNTDR